MPFSTACEIPRALVLEDLINLGEACGIAWRRFRVCWENVEECRWEHSNSCLVSLGAACLKAGNIEAMSRCLYHLRLQYSNAVGKPASRRQEFLATLCATPRIAVSRVNCRASSPNSSYSSQEFVGSRVEYGIISVIMGLRIAIRPSKQYALSRKVTAARAYSTNPPKARLNIPIEYSSHPLLHHTSSSLQSPASYPKGSAATRQNLFQAINGALSYALRTDERTLIFGEDVAFGGVFRCSMGLLGDFGPERVFNTPLSEQGIVGFAIGCAAQGMKPIAEIQFADYVYPAFDQLVNEAAKWRYREGDTGGNIGGLVIRMPCGSVGHGALYVATLCRSVLGFADKAARYHSQSPESLFTHIPGLRVVMPRSPSQAKGLLLASIACSDPVIFLEPKVLYRAAVEQVPMEPYEIPLSTAEVVKEGKDLTIISYGQPLYLCSSAIAAAEKDFGITIELLDLRTLYPWDREAVMKSVRKTGRALVVHESMINAGVGAEVAASIQEAAFLHLEAPVQRLGGWATHMGLPFERFNLPDVTRKSF